MKKILALLTLSLAFVATATFAQMQNAQKQGCRLETIDVFTGEIKLIKEFATGIMAPEFTPDGKWIYYNAGGLMYKISAEGGEPIKIDTGDVKGCNNDHVISPDGKTLAISAAGGGQGSRIYVLPIEGGTPRLVTEKGPSYLHGWSRDGKLLYFTGERGGAVDNFDLDIFSVTLDGKTEVRLTNAPGLDDGSEMTPDGKYIWFNSERSGLMQLWRMKPDGSEQTHMVKEDANCWFPHPSPDGKWISYIVYAKGDVEPKMHPANKNVSLRLVSSEGGESRELVKLFGGQGSFNINSWAPDSKRLAYVRYNRLEEPGGNRGIFKEAGDVGEVNGLRGSVQFDSATQTYTVKGSGVNLWGAKDGFYFVFMPVESNFAMSAFQTLMNEGANAHRKAGIMFRETLDEDSPTVFVTVHGDGLTSLQYRAQKAGPTVTQNYDPKDPIPKSISLERKDDLFIVKVGTDKVDPSTAIEQEIILDRKGYLGIYVCSHSNNDYERATFKDVRFSLSPFTPTPVRPSNAAPARSNILFIFTDDHAYQAISAYGSNRNVTPNMDRLAKEGMRFTNCCVTNSICGPSRAVIQTGKYSHINGFMTNHDKFNIDQPTFPKMLQQAGYQTAVVGKWHLECDARPGYDYSEVLIGQGPYYNPEMIRNGEKVKHVGHTTEIITDLSLEWLKNRDKSKPFMLMTQHKAPHRSWDAYPKHYEKFKDTVFPYPFNFNGDYSGRGRAALEQDMTIADTFHNLDMKLAPPNGWNGFTPEQKTAWEKMYGHRKAEYEKIKDDPVALTNWKYQNYMRDYLSCVDAVDDSIGRLLAYLDESGLAEDTIVVYSSDQGFFLGEHGWFDKRFMYNESFKTPLIVRWPGHTKAGAVSNTLVSNLDFPETFLEIAGVPIPDDMQGRSIVPILEGGRPTDWRTSMYYHYYEFPAEHMVKKHEGVYDGRYKLIHFYDDIDEWELYDLARDPNEMRNIYANPQSANEIARLKAELERQKTALKVPPIQVNTKNFLEYPEETKKLLPEHVVRSGTLERLTATVEQRKKEMQTKPSSPVSRSAGSPVAGAATNALQGRQGGQGGQGGARPGGLPSGPATEIMKEEGCRLEFTFEKDEASKIVDSSGKENHGTATGTASAKGKNGESAKRFDGKSQITLAKTSSLNPATLAWTTEIVFKPESPNGQLVMVGGPINGYSLRLYEGKLVFTAVINRETVELSSTEPITDWCKATAILTADKKMVLYIDGKKVGEKAIPSLMPGEPIFGFRIGQGFTGIISSLKLFCGEVHPK